MKRAIILVFAFIAFLTPLRAEKGVFGEPKFTSAQQLVGHVIIPQQDLKDAYYNTIKKEHPDTVWRKRVANPKEGKHYALVYDYNEPFAGSRFKVIRVNDDIRNEKKGFVLESVPDGVIIECKALSISDFGMFEVVDISEQLTESNKGKVFYAGKNDYSYNSIEDYSPIVIDQIQYFFDFSYRGADPELRVKGLFVSGGEYNFSSKYHETIPIISEEDYLSRVKERHISRMKSGKYSLFLTDVVKPKNLKIVKGKIESLGINHYLYEDSFMNFDVVITEKQFEFLLTNKTANTFKVIWDEALYIDENNTSQRVIHKGVRLIDRSNPQAPSIIGGGTKSEELLIPVDNIDYSSYSGEWYKENLISFSASKGKYPEDATVKIVLPIETNGNRYEYVFVFGFSFEYSYPEYREQYFKDHPEEAN